ncbi:MAG TPA: hypothetical protein ENI15_02215 [Spirochaetes bacterium]|nr:hypothetical protein [Spirochaetota bacterium]
MYQRIRLHDARSATVASSSRPLSRSFSLRSVPVSNSNTFAFCDLSLRSLDELTMSNLTLPPCHCGLPCPGETQHGSTPRILPSSRVSSPCHFLSGTSSSLGRGPQPASTRTLNLERFPGPGRFHRP